MYTVGLKLRNVDYIWYCYVVDFVENFQGFFNVLLCLEYQKMEFRMTSHGGHSKLGFKSSFSSHSKFTLLGFGK